jgi:hypothetical protein
MELRGPKHDISPVIRSPGGLLGSTRRVERPRHLVWTHRARPISGGSTHPDRHNLVARSIHGQLASSPWTISGVVLAVHSPRVMP